MKRIPGFVIHSSRCHVGAELASCLSAGGGWMGRNSGRKMVNLNINVRLAETGTKLIPRRDTADEISSSFFNHVLGNSNILQHSYIVFLLFSHGRVLTLYLRYIIIRYSYVML